MKITCHASSSIMNLGAIVRGEANDFWSIIDCASYETHKDNATTDVTLDLNALRRSVAADVRIHINRYHDIYDLIFSPFDSVSEPSILCVSLKRHGNTLIYAGETCAQTADPFDFYGSPLNAKEESEIERIVIAALV